MAPDTTNPSYWLNWRFLLSAIYVLGTIVLAIFLIWKHEGGKKVDNERRENGVIPVGVLYQDEVWKTCLKTIHPAFLLAFRTFAFVLLLGIITGNVIVSGPGIFFFYTQWTFTLTTIYFGLATTLSLHGCWSDRDGAYHSRITSQNIDAEQGSNVAPKLGGSANMPLLKSLNNREEVHVHHIAGSMCYLLQILYQVAAGAVLLTDVVFWLVIYPFLTGKYYKLAFFDISMHSVNILILGDAILNCMRFPMFRISYFIMWTGAFVICQWIIHACVNL
ncbi:C-C chemokine receptor type 1, partial [Bienertia sinuspersici]